VSVLGACLERAWSMVLLAWPFGLNPHKRLTNTSNTYSHSAVDKVEFPNGVARTGLYA
jgi:hypothetical protein